MIRTSSVNGSEEIKDNMLGMSIETLTCDKEFPQDDKYHRVVLTMMVKYDQDDCGSRQVDSLLMTVDGKTYKKVGTTSWLNGGGLLKLNS